NDTLRMEEGQQQTDLSATVEHQASKPSAVSTTLTAKRDNEQELLKPVTGTSPVIKESSDIEVYEEPQPAASVTQEQATGRAHGCLRAREGAESLTAKREKEQDPIEVYEEPQPARSVTQAQATGRARRYFLPREEVEASPAIAPDIGGIIPSRGQRPM